MELENWIIIGINNGVSKSLHVTRTSKCLTQLRNYWNFKPVKQFRPKLGWTYIYILIGSDNHAVEHVQCLIVWCNDWNRCLYQFARSYTIYIILYISYNIYIILYISLAEFWNSHYFVFDSKVEFYSKNTINFFEIPLSWVLINKTLSKSFILCYPKLKKEKFMKISSNS